MDNKGIRYQNKFEQQLKKFENSLELKLKPLEKNINDLKSQVNAIILVSQVVGWFVLAIVSLWAAFYQAHSGNHVLPVPPNWITQYVLPLLLVFVVIVILIKVFQIKK